MHEKRLKRKFVVFIRVIELSSSRNDLKNIADGTL